MVRTPSRIGMFVAVVVAASVALIGIASSPAVAAPDTDDEGGTSSLRDQLDAASKGFLDAQTALAKSKKRQAELTTQLGKVQVELTARTATIGELANVAYRRGRFTPVLALLNSDRDGFVDRVAALDTVASTEDKQLRDLINTRDQVTRSKAAIDREIGEQQKQLATMTARKKQAENALAAFNATQDSSGSSSGGASSSSSGSSSSKTATQGPTGSGSCSVDDPTTSGCITPRTLHAMQQAKAAGFTRFVSCFRSGGSGEHPKGRACDFAAQKNGFGGVAAGGDKTYGTNLANFFINNASRLGVLYVIWFREIWLPSSGWKSYSGCCDPSATHENHVHLSVT